MGMEFELVEPWEMQDTYGTTNTGKNIMLIRSDVYDRAVQGVQEIGSLFVMNLDIICFIDRNQ